MTSPSFVNAFEIATAVNNRTKSEGDLRPFVNCAEVKEDGMMAEMTRAVGGGLGSKCELSPELLKDAVGTGNEMIEHAKEMFDIHRDFKRGSSESPPFSQYLQYADCWRRSRKRLG